MPKAYPQEFRADVVRIARLGELTYPRITREFGISETCVSNWVRKAYIEDGKRPGTTPAEVAELREARRRILFLGHRNEILRWAAMYLGRGTLPR